MACFESFSVEALGPEIFQEYMYVCMFMCTYVCVFMYV